MVQYCSWNGLISLYAWGDAEAIHRFEETCTIGTYLLHSVIAYKIRNACKLPKSRIPSRHAFTNLVNTGMYDYHSELWTAGQWEKRKR